MDAPPQTTSASLPRRTQRFIRSVGAELGRTTWPSKETVMRLTGVVIVFVTVVALFLGGIDWAAQQALSMWLSL
jgi:preprotein translocase SecE subunit